MSRTRVTVRRAILAVVGALTLAAMWAGPASAAWLWRAP